MKALVYLGPERMEIEEMESPSPREGEVLLEVSAAGICGSDIHGFLGHSERRKPGLVMGHETVARIAETHPTVSGWKERDRVCFNPLLSCASCPACLEGRQNVCADWRIFGMDRLHGTYAEYVSVPACQLFALPESLPEREAILIEPVAVVIHALRISMNEQPRTLAIFGAGPLGALALAVARLRGVPRIAVVDVNERRLHAARRLGADLLVDASREDAAAAVRSWAEGRGAEHVVEAVGRPATRRAAAAATASGGRLVFLGLAENDSALPWIEMIRKEQAVFTSFAYTPRDFEAAVRLVAARRFDLTPWTEERPLSDGQAAFAKMAHAPEDTLKLMLRVKAGEHWDPATRMAQ
jgi:2-desacetyl-2-hydroxyethyl bacteriochlorophyllide A dehydrogenase